MFIATIVPCVAVDDSALNMTDGSGGVATDKVLPKMLFKMLVDMRQKDRNNVRILAHASVLNHSACSSIIGRRPCRCVCVLAVCLAVCFQANERSELQLRIQELENEIETTKSSMMALQLEFERKRTELESEHDKATSWLVRLHCKTRSYPRHAIVP